MMESRIVLNFPLPSRLIPPLDIGLSSRIELRDESDGGDDRADAHDRRGVEADPGVLHLPLRHEFRGVAAGRTDDRRGADRDRLILGHAVLLVEVDGVLGRDVDRCGEPAHRISRSLSSGTFLSRLPAASSQTTSAHWDARLTPMQRFRETQSRASWPSFSRSSGVRSTIRRSASSQPSSGTSSTGKPEATISGYSAAGEQSIGYPAPAYSRPLSPLFPLLNSFCSSGTIPKSAAISARLSW